MAVIFCLVVYPKNQSIKNERHDKATEDLQRAQIEWTKKRQERLDYINNEIVKERKAEKRFMDLNSAMQEYFLVTGRQLEPLPPKPVPSDFYVPSEDHQNRELAFITLSMIRIGAFLWYSDKYDYISYNYMSIYIGNNNNFEDRLKALEAENEYNKVVHGIDHIIDLHLDSSSYKQSMDIDNYFKIKEWHDYSIEQLTVIQQLDKKRPKLSNLNQTQNRRRYVNFENGSHFICSLNLNSPELTVFIAFRMNNIASENLSFFNSIISNTTNRNTAKLITFYKTNSDLDLLISRAHILMSSMAWVKSCYSEN